MNEIFPQLVTDRLILRCIDSADAPAVADMMTPAVARWLANWVTPMTVEMAAERIARARALAAEKKVMPLAVVRKADQRFMGWAGVSQYGEGKAGLGYWLGEPFHGQGYMREAAPAVLRAGMDFMRTDTIIAGCQPENAASIALLKRCGMRFIGERMHPAPARGRDELCWFFEITRDQLPAQR